MMKVPSLCAGLLTPHRGPTAGLLFAFLGDASRREEETCGRAVVARSETGHNGCYSRFDNFSASRFRAWLMSSGLRWTFRMLKAS